MRTGRMAVYMLFLAVVDTFTLISGFIAQVLPELFKIELRETMVGCYMVYFVLGFSGCLSAWTLVIMTVERFIVIAIPLTAGNCLAKAKIVLLLLGIVVLSGSVNSSLIFMNTWEVEDKHCIINEVWGDNAKLAIFTLYSPFPVIVLLVLNMAIIIKMNRFENKIGRNRDSINSIMKNASRRSSVDISLEIPTTCTTLSATVSGTSTPDHQCQYDHMGSRTSRSNSIEMIDTSMKRRLAKRRHSLGVVIDAIKRRYDNMTEKSHRIRNKRMTIMLLTVTFSYFILTTPYTLSIYIILGYALSEHDHKQLASVQSNVYLAQHFLQIFLCLNHSINIVLYCGVGSRFRREFKAMFTQTRKKSLCNLSITNSGTPVGVSHEVIGDRYVTDSV